MSFYRSFTASEDGKQGGRVSRFLSVFLLRRDMYFRIGRGFGFWVWHVEQVGVWGVSLSQEKAKACARASILADRPNLAEFRLKQMGV